MRITSFAPSMTQPTYAVSSAPQGTFGASTPVARSVAPAATETQRSGGLPTSRQFLTGATALVASLPLAGCWSGTAKLAESLGAKVEKPAETALVRTFTPSAGLNILESLVPNPIAKGLGADSIATVPGSLTPEAKATGTALLSSVTPPAIVAQGVECRLANVAERTTKIPPNVMSNDTPVIGGEPDETIALRWANNKDGLLKPACLNLWEKTDPESLQLAGLKFQVNGIEAGTVVATNPSTGGACYKADAARALQLAEREKRTQNGQTLSPKAAEIDLAGNDYWDLKQIAENLFGKGAVCAAIDAGLRLANLMNIDGLVEDAGKLYNQFLEESNKLN